jgi:HK97 family phage major capsid protein/HK97 family phage prohead protease
MMENKRDFEDRVLKRSEVVEFKTNDEERTLSFPFSSEKGVTRYFGNEILEHTRESVDLSRLKDGAPLLWNHDSDKVLGVVRGASIKNKRGYADVEFSRNEFATQVWDDISRGILRNVSVGYQIKDLEQRGEDYVATNWEPYEVSIVSIPADNSVGVGRSLDELVTATQEQPIMSEERSNVSSKASTDAPSTSTPVDMTTTPKETLEVRSEAVDHSKAIKSERSRIQEILTVAAKYNLESLGEQYIKEERSVADFNAAVLQNWKPEPTQPKADEADIGLSDKEVRGYSFMRAIRFKSDPNNAAFRRDAAFEIECSAAAEKKFGRSAQNGGLMVPSDVLRRDLKATANGANVVETVLDSGSFIDMLRNQSILDRAGASVLTGLSGNVQIPRQTGGASTYWISPEGASVTKSDQTLDQVALTPRTLGARTEYTRQFMLQSSIEAENFVRNDLSRGIALEVDRAGLYGTGLAGQPLGIHNVPGISTQAFAAAVAAGGPTFSEVVNMESTMAGDNALMGSPCYIGNAAMLGALKVKAKDAGSGLFLLDGNTLNGYATYRSQQVEAGDLIFGNFSDLIIGYWGPAIELTVDPYSLSDTGSTRVVAFVSVDMVVRHPESFVLGA